MNSTPVTLCFLLRDAGSGTEVLLGLKRTGFGTGKIVGIGGQVGAGESDAEAWSGRCGRKPGSTSSRRIWPTPE